MAGRVTFTVTRELRQEQWVQLSLFIEPMSTEGVGDHGNGESSQLTSGN